MNRFISILQFMTRIPIRIETGFDEEAIIEKLAYLDRQGKNHAIVIVSEKLTDVNSLANKITSRTDSLVELQY